MSPRDREQWYRSHESERDYAKRNPNFVWMNEYATCIEQDSGGWDFWDPDKYEWHDVKRATPENKGSRVVSIGKSLREYPPHWIAGYDADGEFLGAISAGDIILLEQKNPQIGPKDILYWNSDEGRP